MRKLDRTAPYARRAPRPATVLSPAVRRYREHANTPDLEPHAVAKDGFHLGRWADRHRIARVLGLLPADREAELDAIGFDWKVPRPAGFDSKHRRMLLEIAAYREKHGTGEVPSTYLSDDGEPVGEWLYRKVRKWRDGHLPADEQAVLELLGISPTPRPRGPRTARRGRSTRQPAALVH
ncbi:helicase associated domain-containing protein (plasmid) [Rhodococcus pyridinivorans]|uniref:helicase associated domain-containing protein n=1 Tax=Rhodococcus pyridinivorans TaxID=103816 RepID=UPI0020C61A17|nr:helicase associated domain-containing protein [Rhodococcus pyridinivorans]UTM40180.1 helicase associated domain-containing protein [Rhodococcus pyridinivorans]